MVHNQKGIALDILKLENRYDLLYDDLFDFKMELDKIKSSILDNNIFIHVNTSDNNSSDSDSNKTTKQIYDDIVKNCKPRKRHIKFKTKSKFT